MITLTLALAMVIAAVVAFLPRGGATPVPEPLEGVFPLPGDVVVRQTGLEVDLPVGYRILGMVVDGMPLDVDELSVIEATGDWSWQPGPGQVIEAWTAGDHTVYVRWDRTEGGNPDPGEYAWTFRVT